MKPICTDCKVEMRVQKNGIKVAHENIPTWVRSGDSYRCPNCGNEIVTNFGDAYESPNHDLIIKDAISESKERILVDFENSL
jgi:predicted RNA-binding Zn-ribbon protein involved in translation (DUF1610 family)